MDRSWQQRAGDQPRYLTSAAGIDICLPAHRASRAPGPSHLPPSAATAGGPVQEDAIAAALNCLHYAIPRRRRDQFVCAAARTHVGADLVQDIQTPGVAEDEAEQDGFRAEEQDSGG
jgi:hypothetical protein